MPETITSAALQDGGLGTPAKVLIEPIKYQISPKVSGRVFAYLSHKFRSKCRTLVKRRLIFVAMIVGIVPALCQAQQRSQPDQETKPIIYGLVIDASKSIGSQFNDVIEAAKTIVNNNKPAIKPS